MSSDCEFCKEFPAELRVVQPGHPWHDRVVCEHCAECPGCGHTVGLPHPSEKERIAA